MGSVYVLIASVLVYVGMVRASAKYDLGVVFSAVVTAIGMFGFTLLFKLPTAIAIHAALSNLLTLSSIVTLVVQFVVALVFFSQLKRADDTIEAWFGWAIVGGIIIPIAIPFVVTAVLG